MKYLLQQRITRYYNTHYLAHLPKITVDGVEYAVSEQLRDLLKDTEVSTLSTSEYQEWAEEQSVPDCEHTVLKLNKKLNVPPTYVVVCVEDEDVVGVLNKHFKITQRVMSEDEYIASKLSEHSLTKVQPDPGVQSTPV
jgi:hypothetical protein